MKKTFYFFPLFYLLLFASCIDFDAKKALEVKIPQEWQASLQNENKPQKLEIDWWHSAQDEDLNKIIKKILAENLSVKQAYWRLIAARQDHISPNYLPNVNGDAGLNYSKVISGKSNNFFLLNNSKKSTNYYNADVDVSWEIPLFGQFGATKNQLKSDISYAVADMNLIKTSLISEAIKVYSQIRLEQNRLQELEKIIKARERILHYITIKNQAGFSNNINVEDARKSYLSAVIEQSHSQFKLISYQRELATLLSQTKIDEIIVKVKEIPDFVLPQFTNTPLDVMRNRPDIQKSEALVLSALANHKIARSEMFPRITLNGDLALSNNLVGKATLGRSLQLTAQPAISIPLFDWGKRLANDKITNAKLYEASENYKEVVVAALNEVETFLSAYYEAQKRQKDYQKIMENMEKITIDTKLLNEQGFKDGIDVESSVIDSARTRIALQEAKVTTIIELVSLAKSLGGYYQNPDQISFYEK